MKKIIKTLLLACCVCSGFASTTSCSDDNSQSVDNPSLTISRGGSEISQVNVRPSGSSLIVQVQSNTDWSLTSDADWLTLSNLFASGLYAREGCYMDIRHVCRARPHFRCR